MAWLVDFAIRFRVLVLATAAALVFFGAARLERMPVDILPEFAPPRVEIQTEGPGLSASEVEVMVSLGVEELMSGLPWLKSMQSSSVAGLSTVQLEFEPGTPLMRARQLVQERLTTAFLLPNVAKPPVMQQPTSSTNRVMMVAMSSKTVNPIDLSVVAQWTVKPKLLGVAGVAKVAIWGERRRQLQVLVDPAKLRKHGITQKQIIASTGDSLWVSNLSFLKSSVPGTGGYLDSRNQRMEIRHVLPVSSAKDLAKIGIDGTKLKLGDVADVVEGHPPLIGDAVVKDGHGLLLVIEKFPGTNTLEVTRRIEAALDELRPGLSGIKVDGRAFRPATFIEWCLKNIGSAALAGGLLATVGVALLLLSWRALVIGIVAIPLSLLAAGLVLYAMGATANTLMLAGFGAAITCIIDDFVTSAESLHRRMRARGGTPLGGIAVGSIILDAALDSRKAILFASLIALLAISPVFFLEGLTGTFIQPLAVAYVLALLASLLVALTVVPALTALLASWTTEKPGKNGAPIMTRAVTSLASRAVRRVIEQPYRAGMVAIVLGTIAVATAPFFLETLQSRGGLLPRFEERDVLINWEAAPGISQSEMFRITSKVTNELRALPGVRSVNAHFGRAVSGDQTVSINSSKIWVRIDSEVDYDRSLDAIQATLETYVGIKHKMHTYLNDRLGGAIAGGGKNFVVRLYGAKRKQIQATAIEIRDALASIDGLGDVRIDRVSTEPQVEVEVDLATAAKVGIKPGDVRRAASTWFAGLEVGKIFEAQKVFDVVVWSTPESRHSVTSIINAQIELPGGGYLRLGDVASVSVVPTPSLIKREGLSQYADVVATMGARDYDPIVTETRSVLANIDFKLGYHPKILSQDTAQPLGQIRILVAALVAALGILLLLQVYLGSWRAASMVFLTLPLALSGALVAVYLYGGSATLGSLFGMLAIYALTARQGLAMVSRYQQLQDNPVLDQTGTRTLATLAIQAAQGLAVATTYERVQDNPEKATPVQDNASEEQTGARAQALPAHQAALDRSTPVIITAITIGLAVAPIIYFAERPGLELMHPMAIAILGGVFTMTMTILLVLPSVLMIFGSNREPELALG